MSGNFLAMIVKSEKFCPAPPTLVSVWWVVWSFWAYINEPRDPKDLLYKAVELASSFSDLQKLTFFGCASRLRFGCLLAKIVFFEYDPPKDAKTKRGFHGVSRYFRIFKVPTKLDGGKPG
jgi:hypothetical protein